MVACESLAYIYRYCANVDDFFYFSNYVDQSTAVAKNLTYAHGNTLILRADHTTKLSSSGPGRDSVRIRSVKTYTTHVAV
jgi:hypothetical protein